MSSDAWPSPDQTPSPLPRIEDLPISEQGYDQEAVRLAFDSFYRHAAQLDASLRALEAVEVFRRDADALRNDLRALRALGLGRAQEPAWATQTYARERSAVPAVVFRLGAEAALIVAVAVVAGVAHFSAVTIVILMAAAFAIVAAAEWLAARSRFIPPAVAFISEGEPAPYVEAPAPWQTPALEPGEDTEPDALTIVAQPATVGDDEPADDEEEEDDEDEEAEEEEAEPASDPWEQQPDDAAEPEPELAERAGFFRRRRR